MKRNISIIKALAIGGMLSLALTVPILAVSPNARGVNAQQGQTNTAGGTGNGTGSSNSSLGKLDDAKKKICQGSENRIQNMFNNMNRLSERQMNVFNDIAERVKAYYVNNNLKVDNYDQLVQKIETARIAVQTTLQANVRTASQFGCDKDNPKGVATQFKAQVKTQIQELKDYRTAVKNLITAVSTAAESAEG